MYCYGVYLIDFIFLAQKVNIWIFTDLLNNPDVPSLFLTNLFLITIFIIMTILFFVPEKLNYPSMVGFVLVLFLVIYYMLLNFSSDLSNFDTMEGYMSGDLLSLISIISFSIEKIPILLPVRYTLKETKNMLKVGLV